MIAYIGCFVVGMLAGAYVIHGTLVSSKIRCRECKTWDGRPGKDSRPEKDRVRRLRQCGRCGALIPTIERVDLPRLRKREKGKEHG